VSRKPKAGTVTFRPRARLLKLIGEELISDDVVAVAELVKNAHDADALNVTVSFQGVTTPIGVVEIRDDGCGMNLDTLLGRWMQPAATTKTALAGKITGRGRRVLGEKGVGRFAADKLARRLELVSRCPGSPDEVCAVVDWDGFADGEKMLEDVKTRWEVRRAVAISTHGTTLRMTGLRTTWTERMFRRLSIRLGRLLSPFRDRDRFSIRIESDEFPEYSGELRSDIMERAPYRIEASFDGRQTITVTTPRVNEARQRWNGQGELTCGPVRIRLFVYDLEAEALARIGPRVEVRAWLREWTGVSVYRDGFRVWPYGEPHDDWLRLDQRRVNNPVEHLSNNQIIGFIDITRDGNLQLLDQTNREGLVQNRAVDDLRRLVYFVLQVVEAERQSIRHPVRRGHPSATAAAEPRMPSLAAELERLAEKAGLDLGRELRQLGERLAAEQTREQAMQERLLVGYEGLAAVGQLATHLFPFSPQELGQLRCDLQVVRRGAAAANGQGQVFERLAAGVESLARRLEIFQLTAGGGNDRRRAIDLVAEMEAFRRAVCPAFEARDIRLDVEYPEQEVIRTEMRPEHFHGLLHVLAANSLDWIDRGEGRRVRVSLGVEAERCEVVFSDTGPGIPAELARQVFEAGFSMKEGGRGMGLTLARRIIEAHGGSINVIVDGRRRGANLRVVLPRKRSRATFGRR
jgi:signal transduction histidine kinase